MQHKILPNKHCTENNDYGCCGVGSNPAVGTNNKTIMGYYKKCGTCHLCEDTYKAYLESGIYEPIRCTAMHGEMNIKAPINFSSMAYNENDNIKEIVSTLFKWKQLKNYFMNAWGNFVFSSKEK